MDDGEYAVLVFVRTAMMLAMSTMNIFISRPSTLGDGFEQAYAKFDEFLSAEGLTPRRLGRSDYSRKAPLRAVIDVMDQCVGAIVMGYPQVEVRHEVRRSAQVQNAAGYIFPTPWNQIEGALAFRRGCPVLVIAHEGISGGVFDFGTTGEMVLSIDMSQPEWFKQERFSQPYREWLADVRRA